MILIRLYSLIRDQTALNHRHRRSQSVASACLPARIRILCNAQPFMLLLSCTDEEENRAILRGSLTYILRLMKLA